MPSQLTIEYTHVSFQQIVTEVVPSQLTMEYMHALFEQIVTEVVFSQLTMEYMHVSFEQIVTEVVSLKPSHIHYVLLKVMFWQRQSDMLSRIIGRYIITKYILSPEADE